MTITSITKPTTTQIQTPAPELDKPLQPIPTKEIAPLPPIDKANDHSAYTTMKNNLFAGAMAGVVADSVTHPICTVKARLMCQGAGAGQQGVKAYRGLTHGLSSILRTEGVRGLYKGMGIVVCGAAPAQALYFGGYEATRKVLGDNPTSNFVAGIAAQLSGSVTFVPMEIIKEKLMIQNQIQTKKTYSGSFSLLNNIIKTEGVRGIYRGFALQQFTYAPFNAFSLMFYNELKKQVPNQYSSDASNFACSALAYSSSAILTNGFDVVKTRRQVQTSNPELFNYKSGWDCARQIAKNEGLKGFLDGVSGRVFWLMPRMSIAMTSYEYLSKQFNGNTDND